MMLYHLALVVLLCSSAVLAGKTSVSIVGTQFYINGKVSNPGSPAQGLLLNSRMSQAIFNDENTATSQFWNYPDTHNWNASRNTMEFVANVSTYSGKGLNAITVGMQGSDPDPNSGPHNVQAIISAFTNNGQLKQDWVGRLGEVLKATDSSQLVVILNLFDLSQEHRLNGDDSTIITAVQSVVQFLAQQQVTNVVLDLADACSNAYSHQMLTPNSINQLMKVVKVIAPHIPVSTSFPPGVIPPDNVIEAVDYVLLHGTGLNRTGLNAMIRGVRNSASFRRSPMPILVNQDSPDIGNLAQAVSDGVSWGFYSQGQNDYSDGYCSPPVNWGINTIDKKSFFDEVTLLTQN